MEVPKLPVGEFRKTSLSDATWCDVNRDVRSMRKAVQGISLQGSSFQFSIKVMNFRAADRGSALVGSNQRVSSVRLSGELSYRKWLSPGGGHLSDISHFKYCLQPVI
ncbi:hypothetical protein RRG08_035149 [Elysia crispata]|uniref:Uncharacterized protein n=1 Tax=Elysia crispata TaxID=231223 RepID=A0AAE1AK89_9GAST|nr:hypothetical protein RRG08_035149 [Elysia crispata]